MVNLIKSGAFEQFGNSYDLMYEYVKSISDAKKRITLQNMKMLIDFDLIPDEYADKYAKELLQKEDEVRRIYEHELEDKVVDFLAEQVKLEDNEISVDEFMKLFK